MILVDSSVLLDVIKADAAWANRSTEALDHWGARGAVIINPIVYAEISVAFARKEELDGLIARAMLTFHELPQDALFLAAKAHLQYRRRGGVHSNVLADFFIGAHAAVARVPLLTRDVSRVRSYFPTVHLVSPE